MKKFTPLPCLFALALIVATPVYAQTATRSGKMNREEFRAKVSAIRDEKKKALVERMDTKMKELNAKRTAILLRHLDKIEEILNRIETRALEVEKGGKDIASVKTAVQKAKDAIAAARTAVNVQAAKTYIIDITTEDKLGAAVSAARTTLARDLQATHQAVVAARKSVREVLTALAKVVGEKLTNTTEK
ncbi:MAG: hypothetical protein AAB548_02055 [Patescibacteria group bacterium]